MMDGVSYHTYYGFAIVGWEERVDGILGMISTSPPHNMLYLRGVNITGTKPNRLE